MGIGLVLLTIFIVLERRIKYPMVDLSLFRNRLFSMGNLSSLLNYMAQFTVIWIMPFYLQQLRHLTAAQAGMLLIPMPLVTMVVAPASGTLSDKTDTRYVSSVGMGITAAGLWLLSGLHAESSTLRIIVALVITGLGVGMFQTPNNSAVMGTVPPQRRGIASSLLATMRNIGMVLGVAVSGAVFTGLLAYFTKSLANQGLSGSRLTVQAFTGSMHYTYLVAAGLACLAVLTSLVRGPLNAG